jgi:hypothetical protein
VASYSDNNNRKSRVQDVKENRKFWKAAMHNTITTPTRQIVIPYNPQQANKLPESDDWKRAIETENTSHAAVESFEFCSPEQVPADAKVLGSRYVFDVKTGADGEVERFKARLVIKGCEQDDTTLIDTYASTIQADSFRFFVAHCVKHNLNIQHLDIVTAFLHAQLPTPEFASLPPGMQPPPEAVAQHGPNLVLKLKRAVYGLKQSGALWEDRLDRFLISRGFTRFTSDRNIYSKTFNNNDNSSRVFIAKYVDDIFVGSKADCQFARDEIAEIKREFNTRDLGQLSFSLGIRFTRNADGMRLDQTSYARSILEEFGMTACNPSKVPITYNNNAAVDAPPLDEGMKRRFQKLVGMINYLAIWTRPDLSYSVHTLASAMDRPTEEDWKVAKQVLRYLAGTVHLGLNYNNHNATITITGFCDSDYAGDVSDRKSINGNLFMMANGPISWSSRKQPVVALSSTEAEYISLAEEARVAVWLQQLAGEFGYKFESIPINIDNNSALQLAKSNKTTHKSKHIAVKYHFTRDLLSQREPMISLQHIPSEENTADIFTKALAKIKFVKHREALGLT